ncbi:MAG: Na/Pi cotransporter family protein [Bacteroidaceae bacterium]|nr:Na/Pi cotransporter family protein [Bacteroidaceae bacterium]
MNYSFFDFLTLVGALGMFLYGMKIMSEGLQKAAGDRMQKILSSMTNNRIMGVLTGVLITALIQSSSATTVMVVSFVNAGLLSLVQSIAVIMGANVGTTVTAWIISLFGFTVKIADVVFPVMAISIPLIFSKNNQRRYWGEFLIGFSLLFLGMEFMKDSVPNLQENPAALEFLNQYTNMGYGSILLFMIIGSIMTIIMQSSSATMAITLIMCSQGWISFEIAAAMVLGENIGTTITANMAALSANVSAKRAAFAHFLFNIFGVCWMLILFYPFTHMIIDLVGKINGMSVDEVNYLLNSSAALLPPAEAARAATTVSFSLALFHSVFNVCNVLIMIWFVKLYEKIVTTVIKQKSSTDEEFQLKYISTGMMAASELNLPQARQEIVVYAERVRRMFGMIQDLLHEKEGSEAYSKLYSRIEKYEQICDRMEIEIASFLNKVVSGRLSYDGKLQVNAMLTMVTEIESIGDSCYNLARTLVRKQEAGVKFNDEIMSNIDALLALDADALDSLVAVLSKGENADIIATYNKENEINNFRNQLRSANMENINTHMYNYQEGIYYMDIVAEAESLSDYIVNVVDAVKQQSHHKMKV